jgi:hypothetical protein
MALINCDECGNQVSDKAVSCPGCGAPIKQVQPVRVKRGSRNVGCLTVFVALFIVFYVASSFMDTDKTPASTTTATELSILAPIKSFIAEHPEFGEPRSTSEVPDWRYGQRQRIIFESGRNLLFYIHEGEVITVYEDSPNDGRKRVWGESFDLEAESKPQ